MKIDKQKALKAFQEYTTHYDVSDEKVKLKIDHTYRVCGLCQQIAVQSGFDENEIELAWLTGLLHDVGRFEQLKIWYFYRCTIHRSCRIWRQYFIQRGKN